MMSPEKNIPLNVMIDTQFSKAKREDLVVRIYVTGVEDPFTFRGIDAQVRQESDTCFQVENAATTIVFVYSAIAAVSVVKSGKPQIG